ncbi:hypothetical protein SLEP1_g34614 [Rubroshorea leprosula]|uniref:Uncharacterized protein n=1 Tax=Rubroshorea leprosula TaxID=152421 RepID=A0AAV5KKI3_9ROSI|nr:hypothetical protein SLEP1_g34614 [Rubroshorea leprosula]
MLYYFMSIVNRETGIAGLSGRSSVPFKQGIDFESCEWRNKRWRTSPLWGPTRFDSGLVGIQSGYRILEG